MASPNSHLNFKNFALHSLMQDTIRSFSISDSMRANISDELPMVDEHSFLKLDALSDIDRLISNGVEENLNLDYKASPALARESKAVDEMCKDISAFANSAGGQLVYGVAEDKKTRKPTDTDPGVTDPKITREWIEQ